MTDGSLQLWNNIGKRSLSFFVFNINRHLTCEQRLHFPWVSWRAKSSLCGQLFNFLSCMREIRHAIREQNQIVRSVVKWREFRGNKKIATTLICYARLTQCSKPVKNSEKKTRFLDLFVQISGRIWTVVGRGYFSHASSHSENVASARRVTTSLLSCSNVKFVFIYDVYLSTW